MVHPLLKLKELEGLIQGPRSDNGGYLHLATDFAAYTVQYHEQMRLGV